MNSEFNIHSGFNYFILDDLQELTEENKNIIIPNITNNIIFRSQFLIESLISNPEEKEKYRYLEARIEQIDPQLVDQIHPYIERIQKISDALQASHKSFEDFAYLNLDQLREIPDRDLKGYMMAQHTNRINRVDLAEEAFSMLSKDELIAMGPYLESLYLNNPINLNGSDILDILKAAPNLNSLKLTNCQIEEIPPLKNLKNLGLYFCPIAKLPVLESLEQLLLNDCQMEELPQYENLKSISIENCPIETLNQDSCTSLMLISCWQLREINSLNNIRNLCLNECSNLERIPPNMNYLENFECEGCPYLDENTIPPEFRSAQQYLGGTYLEVKMDELTQNPLKVLIAASNTLLTGEGIPSITFIEENWEESPAIDSGGLSKAFLTMLIESILVNSNNYGQLSFNKDPTTGFYQPILDPDRGVSEEQRNGFMLLGALFDTCLKEELLIDRVFHPSVFKGITSLSAEELDNLPFQPKEISDELIFKLLFVIPPPGEEKYISIFKKLPEELTIEDKKDLEGMTGEEFDDPYKLIEEAKKAYADKMRYQDTFLPIVLMAKQMRLLQVLRGDESWNQYCARGSEAFQEQIEGKVSASLIFDSIEWKSSLPDKKNKDMKLYVKKWLNEAEMTAPIKLRDFLFTVTSLKSLSKEEKLTLNLFDGNINRFEGLPRAHTCFASIDLSGNYPDYETFKAHLEGLIASSKIGSGFGME